MSLVLYNSLSRKKETFEPAAPPQVKMYCCGPTVYGLLHVGNFRGAIVYNLLRNWLEHLGFKVTYVYNYTDVDDKIIHRAKEDGVEASVVSEKYIEEFKKDYSRLGLRPHDQNPKVTEYMPEIIKMISDLITEKKAYVVNSEVLYSIEAFTEYGKLSGRNPDDMLAGVRIEVDRKKQSALDFALWKPAKEGEPFWDSPWGKGRPGWHIECSAMNRAIFGDQIDIHGGGMDLIFPHHENEIAQTEGVTHKVFAKYWIHNNMINFGGTKMSKSLGNIISGRDFMDQNHPEIFKWMILSVHYRSVSDFNDQSIQIAIKGLGKIYSALALADHYLKDADLSQVKPEVNFEKEIQNIWNKMQVALNDDLNTAEMFAHLYELIKLFNTQVKLGMKTNPAIVAKALAFKKLVEKVSLLTALFGEKPAEFLIQIDNLLLAQKELKREVVDSLVKERWQVRLQKDFKKSDELRDHLLQMGISISDTADGCFWEVTK